MSTFAVLIVLSAALAHASWNIILHGVSRSGIPFLLAGAIFTVLVWTPVVPLTGGLGGGSVRGLLLGVLVSGILHVIYQLVLQQGYARGNLSTVYATARGSGPMITVVFAVLLLGERPTGVALIGVAIIIAGVLGLVVVDRSGRSPSAASDDDSRSGTAGIVFGVLTGIAIAAYTLWDTFAIREWNFSPVAFMVGCALVEAVVFTVLMPRKLAMVRTVMKAQWDKLLAVSFLSGLSYILILHAVTIAPVSLVAPLREVSVVLVSLFAAFVFREGNPLARVGASLVIASGIVVLAA